MQACSRVPAMRRTDYRMVAAATVLAASLTTGTTSALAADPESYVSAWAASPVAPATSMPTLPAAATVSVPLEFAMQSLRQRVNPTFSGTSPRIRLSNKFGTHPVTFKSIYLGETATSGIANVAPGTNHRVLFSGRDSITLAPGERAYSDPVDMTVHAFDDLAISFYLPTPTGPATQHTLANQVAYLAVGDHASEDSGAAYVPSGVTSFFITDVDVVPAQPSGSIVFVGDSITDGFLYTTINANHRYTDFLARRLQADPLYDNLAVVNEGISGNRVLKDNIGPSALHRLEDDALSQPNVKAVVLADGLNDLANPPFIGTTDLVPATADEVIAGMKEFADRVHAAGKEFYAATITPSGDLTDPAGPPFETYSLPAVNAARQKINAWIRTSGTPDHVLDFDKVLADPKSPNHTKAQYKGVDGVHPTDAGYKALADDITLSKFKGLVTPDAVAAPYRCTATVGSRRLKTAIARGLRASASCTRSSTLTATLTVSAATARKLKLGSRTVATGRATKLMSKRTFALRFTQVAKTRLKGAGAVNLTLKLVATSTDGKTLNLARRTVVRR